MKGLFQSRSFLLLIAASGISQIGSQIAFVGTMFWLRQTADSASLLGLLAAVSALPLLLLSPIGGVFADRWPRRKVLIVCDVLCALLCIPLIFFAGAHQFPLALAVSGVMLSNLLLASCIAFSNPALQSFMPDVVESEQLESALGFTQSLSLIGVIGGQALGALLLSHVSPFVLFCIDGLTYLTSGLLLLFVRPMLSAPRVAEAVRPPGRIFTEMRAAGDYIRRRPGMRLVLIAAIPVSICTETIIVFLPFYTTDLLRESLSHYGYLLSIFSTGLFFGYAVTAKSSIPGERRSATVTLALIFSAIACVSLALVSGFWIAAPLILFLGFSSGSISLLSMNALVSQTDADLRGRVTAVMIMITQGITPLTMSGIGFVVDLFNRNVAPLYGACGAALLLVALSFSSSRDVRAFFGGLRSPSPSQPKDMAL